MIKFFIKMGLWIALLAGGSVLAVNLVPSLKGNIIETINPRIKEQKLVSELQKNLDALSNSSVVTKNNAVVAKSQELLKQISDLNVEHTGLVDAVISKVADVVLGTTSDSTPSASSGQAIPTKFATPSPCK
jgi:hypothetical protein